MGSTAVQKCKHCSRLRRARTACSEAACPSAVRHGLRYAILKPGTPCRPARPASCGSTHRLASPSIWKIRRQPNARSTLTAFSARAISHRSEEHTSELQSLRHLVCRLLLEKKKK